MTRKLWTVLAMLVCLLLSGCGKEADPELSSDAPAPESPAVWEEIPEAYPYHTKSKAEIMADLPYDSFWGANKYAQCSRIEILDRVTDVENGKDKVFVKAFGTIAGYDLITIHEVRYCYNDEGAWTLYGCFDHDEDEWYIELPGEQEICRQLEQALAEDYPGITVKSVEVTGVSGNMYLLSCFPDIKVQFGNYFTGETYKMGLIYHISADGWKFHDFEWVSARPRL